MTLNPGDRIRLTTAGGGGWGNPKQRDPDQIGTDIREGWVSPEKASSAYGFSANADNGDD